MKFTFCCKNIFNDIKSLAGSLPLSVCIPWVIPNRSHRWLIWTSSVTVTENDPTHQRWLHATLEVKSQMLMIASPLAVVRGKQATFGLWRYNERWSVGILSLSFLLFLSPSLLDRIQTHGSGARAGQHTGLYNLITCFICRNLFLNQSGWGRKASSWAVSHLLVSQLWYLWCRPASLTTFTQRIFHQDTSRVCLDNTVHVSFQPDSTATEEVAIILKHASWKTVPQLSNQL